MVFANMAQLPQDKQGYLGNLETKSSVELRDLLLRQQKLLSNEKFIQSLPDKGEKIKILIGRIEKVLLKQDDVDMTSELLDRLQIDAEKSRGSRSGIEQLDANSSEFSEESTLDVIINKHPSEKVVLDQRSPKNDTDKPSVINTYQKIIQKDNKPAAKMSKFKLNSTLRVRKLKELPDELKRPSHDNIIKEPSELAKESMKRVERDVVVLEPSSSDITHSSVTPMVTSSGLGMVKENKGNLGHKQRKHIYDEALEMDLKSTRKHTGIQMLTLEESFKLQQQQQNTQKELIARQAADKLSQKFESLSKMYHPEGSDMRYRENAELDSEESGEELDYPD